MALDISDTLRARHRPGAGGFAGGIVRMVLRFLQFVLAMTVAGLYGVDLNDASQAGVGADAKWVYAEVVAGFSAVSCLVYGLCVCIPSEKFFAWDWIVCILWTVLFGLFGRIYIPAHPAPNEHGQIRMKHAVWVDLTNMLLWFVTASYSTWIFFRGKTHRTLHTGQAKS